MTQTSNAEVALYLGKMYMTGFGVPRDECQALRWLRVAAERSNAEAQFFVGAMYLLRRHDAVEGLKWLRCSAEQGLPDSQLLLGMAYMRGAELPRDLVEALAWLQLAAAQGDQLAASQCHVAESQMTLEQIAHARALAAQMKPKGSVSIQ